MEEKLYRLPKKKKKTATWTRVFLSDGCLILRSASVLRAQRESPGGVEGAHRTFSWDEMFQTAGKRLRVLEGTQKGGEIRGRKYFVSRRRT